MDFKAAKCPNCGGDLQLPENVDTVKCMYCSGSIVVRQAVEKAATESGANLNNLLILARAAEDAGNHEEAYGYFTEALEIDPENYEAWFGKAVAAGWMSTLARFRMPEMTQGIWKATDYSPEDKKEELRSKACVSLNDVTVAYHNLAREHLIECVPNDADLWVEYLEQCETILSVLEVAYEYDPENLQVMKNIINVCKDNIEGIEYLDNTKLDPFGYPVSRLRDCGPEYEAILKEKMALYEEQIEKHEPSYDTPEIEKAKHRCFIATATMGNYDDPRVRLLRRFRDNWIEKRMGGRVFIKHYYRLSPPVANAIAGNETLRYLSYCLIVYPVTILARILLEELNDNRDE